MNNLMLGIIAALAIIVTQQAFTPKPAECRAGQDLKDAMKAQQSAFADLSKSNQKTIEDLLALEKKAMEAVTQSCQK